MGITEEEARRWHEQRQHEVLGQRLESYMRSTPSHRVYLDAFYIGRYPVTNEQYARFVQDTDHRVPFGDFIWVKTFTRDEARKFPPPGKENHPVVGVSWDDAQAYCEWAGLRLPTEAEWEKAACWDATTGRKRVYPWGDEWDARRCNCSEGGKGGTTPGEAHSPGGDSPYGCADMAGNVWEWVADWLGSYPAGRQVNPTGPHSGTRRVARSGMWNSSSRMARCACRSSHNPDDRLGFWGFRCAMSA